MRTMQLSPIQRIAQLGKREITFFAHRPMLLFCIFVAPILFLCYLTSLMGAGTPTKLPAAIVDEDDTPTTRSLLRTIDTMEGIDFRYRYASFSEARQAMQQGRIYAFIYLPRGTTRDLTSSRQPRISFYVNNCYYVAGAQVMRDLKTGAELAGMSATLTTLQARGMTPEQARAAVQPITIEAHPLGNPTMDYSVFLNNMLIPGILLLLAMLMAIYTLGMEWKKGTQYSWFRQAGESSAIALIGKLLPQTVVFTLMMALTHTCFYRYLGFPCRCGLGVMMGWGAFSILAAQGFAVTLFGLMAGQMRMAMCACSLWGILSFSLAGLSFPALAMSPWLQALTWLEPLRHYYLIYANQALNGYPIIHVRAHVAVMAAFALSPCLLLRHYRHAILYTRYVP